MTRFRKMATVFIAALVIGGISSQALANATYGCSVTDVGVWGAYNGGSTPAAPALSITCGGASYAINAYYPSMGGSCPGMATEVIKLWETLATTAFLSRKHLNIWFTPSNSSCGSNAITNVDLVN